MTKAISTAAAAAILLLAGTAWAAADPTVVCKQSKYKAIGKRHACLNKSASAVLAGKPDVSSECETKFATAIQRADAKAASALTSCRYITNGDGTVLDLNTGATCGNGLAESGELCDGADLGAGSCASETPATPYGDLTCNASCSGFVTTACSVRLTDNGDGTVSDIATGLMWEQKDELGGIHDVGYEFTWSIDGSQPNGTLFTDFLGTLNGGTSSDGDATTGCFAGYCDWRLPTIEELRTVLQAQYRSCTRNPCIDPIYGPTHYSSYWSSTTSANDANSAWNVYFLDGYVDDHNKTFEHRARAVRGAAQ